MRKELSSPILLIVCISLVFVFCVVFCHLIIIPSALLPCGQPRQTLVGIFDTLIVTLIFFRPLFSLFFTIVYFPSFIFYISLFLYLCVYLFIHLFSFIYYYLPSFCFIQKENSPRPFCSVRPPLYVLFYLGFFFLDLPYHHRLTHSLSFVHSSLKSHKCRPILRITFPSYNI